jgi:hypothetical protein
MILLRGASFDDRSGPSWMTFCFAQNLYPGSGTTPDADRAVLRTNIPRVEG